MHYEANADYRPMIYSVILTIDYPACVKVIVTVTGNEYMQDLEYLSI